LGEGSACKEKKEEKQPHPCPSPEEKGFKSLSSGEGFRVRFVFKPFHKCVRVQETPHPCPSPEEKGFKSLSTFGATHGRGI
jgi:hypothetical protein